MDGMEKMDLEQGSGSTTEVDEASGDAAKAWSTLEGLIRAPTEGLCRADLESLRWAAIRLLEDAFRSAGQWSRLAQLWELLLLACDEVDGRIRLYEKLLEIYQGPLGDFTAAFGVAARAFSESQGSVFWQEKVEALALGSGRAEELACLYLDVADRVTSSPLSRRLWHRAAELYESTLHNRGEAIALYQHLLDGQPEDAEALSALEWLLSAERRFAELVPVLEKLLESKALSGEREARFLELIRIHEEERGQKMLSFFSACRAFQEGVRTAAIRARMFRLAREVKMTEQLAEMIDEWLPDIADPSLQEEVLRERASLVEGLAESTEQAIARWRSALAESPQDAQALLALRQLYQDGEHPGELADIVSRLIQLEQDLEQKKDLCFELAQLLEEKLGRFQEAIAVYLQILTLDPDDLSALSLLNRLYSFNTRPVSVT